MTMTAVVAAGAATLVSVATAAPAQASTIGGPIERSEVIARAQNWVSRGLTYNQSGKSSDPDGAHTYRRDCSGLVSMVWHLNTSLLTHQFLDRALDNNGMHVIQLDSLHYGDAMVRDSDGDGEDGHMELFSHWVNANDHSRGAYVYSFNTPDETVQNPYVESNFENIGLDSISELRTYTSIRYNNIRDGGQAPASDAVTVSTNTDGRLEQFTVRHGQVFHRYQLPAGGWNNGWESLGGSSKGPVAVGRNTDGRLELFTVGVDGALYAKYQVSAGAGWVDGWNTLGGPGLAGPLTVAPNQDGRLQVFAVGSDGHLYSRYQLTGGGWSAAWDDFGGNGVGAPVTAMNTDGRLEVFAVQAGGDPYNKFQLSPNGGWVSVWSSLAGRSMAGPLTVGANKDGRLQVLAVGADGRLYSRYQLTAGGWSATWDDFGGDGVRTPSMVRNADGRLEVFAVHRDGSLWNKYQLSADGGWVDGWSPLTGQSLAGPLSAAVNKDGRLEVLAAGTDGHIYGRYQLAQGGWSNGWDDHGQP